MRVLVTGGCGFTGRRVVRRLLERGHEVRCLVRRGSDRGALAGLGVEVAEGDLSEPRALDRALRGRDALMNVASIGFGHAPGIVAALERNGVDRALFFSTTAVFTSLPAASRAVRLAAEDAIRDSRLRFTILRPTMIFGGPGDRNVERLLRALSRSPVFPVVEGGRRLVQPVFVDDLAELAAEAIGLAVSEGRAYCVPGERAVPFSELVRRAAEAAGRTVRLLSLPAALAVGAARLAEALLPRPPVRAEQVRRLLEDKDFDGTDARRELGYRPTPLEAALRTEAARLGWGAA